MIVKKGDNMQTFWDMYVTKLTDIIFINTWVLCGVEDNPKRGWKNLVQSSFINDECESTLIMCITNDIIDGIGWIFLNFSCLEVHML